MTVSARNFQEQEILGRQWLRASRVTIDNPYGGVATICFDEQTIREIDGTVTTKPGGIVSCAFDPHDEVALIDPLTLEPTGQSIPQSTAYVMLFSMFVRLQNERTAQLAQEQA